MNSTRKGIAEEVRKLKLNPEILLDKISDIKQNFFLLSEINKNNEFNSQYSSFLRNGYEAPIVSTKICDTIIKEVFQDISCDVDSITSSLLSPCLHLNNYLECSASDIEWDEIKYTIEDKDEYPSSKLRRISTDIYGVSILISIKSALDRLVRILSYYYPGISSHTTWGRYKENQKKEGFMGVVRKRQNTDKLLNYFDTQYNDWIKYAVAPRDSLIHYRDSVPSWYFDSKSGALIQSHVTKNSEGKSQGYGIYTLEEYVTKWFKFMEHTLYSLSTKCPIKLTNKTL